MNKTVRINLRSVVNRSGIREETRNGRKVVIVPSATLPDGVVMNGIRYPADEIEKSYKTLNRKPAPLGHPTINGQYVSASDPEGINVGYIGAWNENVRREKGRVWLDKVIDVEVANRSDGGRRVLEAINGNSPIHTSTGLLCQLETANDDSEAEFIARNMEFDHDAILLDEEGAATPDQGVGMMVNGKQVQVINSTLAERSDMHLDWAAEEVARVLEQRARIPLIEKIKAALVDMLPSERKTSANQEKDDMADEKQLADLSAKVNAIEESMTKGFEALGKTLGETIGNALKPLTDNLSAMQANEKAKEEAEKTDLIEKIVKANLLSEAAAKELTLNAARELAKKAVPGKAMGLNGAPATVQNSEDDEFKGYSLNALIEEKK